MVPVVCFTRALNFDVKIAHVIFAQGARAHKGVVFGPRLRHELGATRQQLELHAAQHAQAGRRELRASRFPPEGCLPQPRPPRSKYLWNGREIHSGSVTSGPKRILVVVLPPCRSLYL